MRSLIDGARCTRPCGRYGQHHTCLLSIHSIIHRDQKFDYYSDKTLLGVGIRADNLRTRSHCVGDAVERSVPWSGQRSSCENPWSMFRRGRAHLGDGRIPVVPPAPPRSVAAPGRFGSCAGIQRRRQGSGPGSQLREQCPPTSRSESRPHCSLASSWHTGAAPLIRRCWASTLRIEHSPTRNRRLSIPAPTLAPNAKSRFLAMAKTIPQWLPKR